MFVYLPAKVFSTCLICFPELSDKVLAFSKHVKLLDATSSGDPSSVVTNIVIYTMASHSRTPCLHIFRSLVTLYIKCDRLTGSNAKLHHHIERVHRQNDLWPPG